jgi:hypothetical protein
MIKHLNLGSVRVAKIALIIFIAVALMLKLVNVFNAPAHWDTGLYLNIAVGYFERGVLTPLMWRFNPEWNIVTGSGSGYAIFLLLGWTKLFGISVLSGHLMMYVVGVLNLPVIYVLAKRFYKNEQAGWWAVGFFALSGTFARDFYARMDALNILTCSLILLLHLEAMRRDKWWLHAAVGVALVAALEVHILAALYAGAIGLYYAINYLQVLLREKRLVVWMPAIAFGVGLGLAAAAYFLHHIAPNPTLYFMIARNCEICHTPLTAIKEMERWYRWFGMQPVLSIFMVGLAILTALLRRLPTDRDFLVMLAGAYIALLVLNPPVMEWYTGHLLPLFALGVGGLYAHGLNRQRALLPQMRGAGLVVSVMALVVLVNGTSFTYARDHYQYPLIAVEFYSDAIHYIREHVPTDTVVMAYETYYLDLIEYRRFMSYKNMDIYAIDIRQETYLDYWQRERPQVFIGDAQADAELWQYMGNGSDFVEVKPYLWIERSLAASIAPVDQRQAFGAWSQ